MLPGGAKPPKHILLLVTKQDSSALYPFSKFWPTEYRADDNATVSSFTGTKVIIGHANDHFQSLKFIEKDNVDKNTVESSQSFLVDNTAHTCAIKHNNLFKFVQSDYITFVHTLTILKDDNPPRIRIARKNTPWVKLCVTVARNIQIQSANNA